MTEPRDDWDAGSSRLASELLRAGRRERASEGARERATQALLGASITASSAAAANAGSRIAGLKWLGISVVLLGASGGLWHFAVHEPREVERRAHVSDPRARATQGEALAVKARGSGVTAASTSSAAPDPTALSPHGTMPSAAPSPAAPSPAPAPVSPARGGGRNTRLSQEVLAVSRARAAVAAGAPERAVAILDAVTDGFQLLPLEASLVRIEALRGTGKLNSARALSEQLLLAHPDDPYTERLHSLAAALGSNAQPLSSSKK